MKALNQIILSAFGVLITLIISSCSPSSNPKNSVPTQEENPVTVLKGQGIITVDFGTILYSQNKTITLKIVNDESGTLSGPASLTGNNFMILNQNNCQSVPMSSVCTIKISLSGSGKSGPYQSVLSLGSFSANLLGVVTPPSPTETVVPSQSAIDFGIVSQKSTNLKTITITNTSQITLNKPTSIGSSFDKPYDYCANKDLEPGKSCIIKIYFRGANKSGAINESLTYGSIATISLTATVPPPTAELQWAVSPGTIISSPPAILNIGSISAGGFTKQIKIKNIGTIPMASPGSSSISGEMSIVYNSCEGKILEPLKECIISVRFNSNGLAVGIHSASLTFSGENRLLSATIEPESGIYPNSCSQAREQGRLNLENNLISGNYMIDPDDTGPIEPFSVYCIHSPTEPGRKFSV